MWSMDVLLPLLAVGAAAGFLAGLLGIGGGAVTVPIVLWFLGKQGIGGAHSQHLAVGTSMAVMVFTTFSSALAQQKKGAVRWEFVRRMAPGLVAGSLLGSLVSNRIPTFGLQVLFVVFCYLVAAKNLFQLNPQPAARLPDARVQVGAGGLFGLLSSWVGIGGGSLSVPFMMYCRVPVHQAVATSSVLAWPIAAAGAAGYLVSGWSVPGLPAGSLGFWYLPCVAALGVCTVLFAPLGVKAAHRLPPPWLRRAFGLLMVAIGSQMLWKLLYGV
ncbi:sulfite exporter TauE/SafE family protein [Eikenella sp. S3360]|uniref:Probable membrane transporter protein n=1 Tax=Eikenella glucosivorans TaxID=2766967 RepID=A0ABS0N734_9NEIS|nr:sulfite exporter TauE/SafE family protein [Eikenella glucosivorans]MBH5328081.1 sulfite exporter TauE/SafE family protein [Eikenella glucosivorans]